MPCADADLFAVKLINTHPENPEVYGIPSIIGCGSLIDGNTGYPVLLTESTILTAIRTAAASTIATKHLANKSERFGIIGAGAQAIPQMHAISMITEFSRVYVSDLNSASAEQFCRSASKLGFDAGFAMEDLVTYAYLYELAEEFGVGKKINIIAKPKNPKDLYESYFL